MIVWDSANSPEWTTPRRIRRRVQPRPAERGWFEVAADRSILEFQPEETDGKKSSTCFGFVHTYDTKPKRHAFNLLKSQGMQENQ